MLSEDFVRSSKPEKNLLDYLTILYKPVYSPLVQQKDQSSDDFEVAEEYNGLVFYITKSRNLFAALKCAVKTMGIKCVPHTHLEWRAAGEHHPALLSIVDSRRFMWLKSVSEIPPGTEFTYLGEIDSVILRNELGQIDQAFKDFAGSIHGA